MKTIAIGFILSTFLIAACDQLSGTARGHSDAPGAEIVGNGTPASRDETGATPKPGASGDKKNLLAIGNGAFVIEKSSEAALNWRAINIVDELATTGWAAEKRNVTDQTLVIELPSRTTFKTLSLDTASVDVDRSGAKDILVELSDTSATEGFKEVLSATLKEKLDAQEFTITQSVPGRWLRLKAVNNYGSADYLELMEIRGYGEQEPITPLANISGTYDSRFGVFHVKQEGTSIVGCYETNEGLIRGGIGDRVMTLNWKDRSGSGAALMVFAADGKSFLGAFGKDTIENGFFGEWSGKKISDKAGKCDHLKTLETGNAVQSQIGKDLNDSGRAVIYGINFDFNSEVIKAESRPTLDQIAAVLLENKDWRMTVEGHTDNIGGDAFNTTLSEKRSGAVKAYLVGKGVDSSRLSSSGLGMYRPRASNETEAGRAQNRRVELVKN